MDYRQMLMDKVNSYKSYSKEVKEPLLSQIRDAKNINKQVYEHTLKSIPKVIARVHKGILEENKLRKKVVKLEVHTYAPELNKLHLKDGSEIKTPNKTTIKDAIRIVVMNNLK